MSEKKAFTYTRKVSIAGLFSPPAILAGFGLLEFKNLASFARFLQRGLHTPMGATSREYRVNLSSMEEIDAYVQIIEGTTLAEDIVVCARLHADVVIPFFLRKPKIKKTHILIPLEQVPKVFDNVPFEIREEILSKNLGWIDVTLTRENFDTVYERLMKTVLNYARFSYIDLKFDYVSFEEAKFEELHKLYFYLSTLANWTKNQELRQFVYDKDADWSTGQIPPSFEHTIPIAFRVQHLAPKAYLDEVLDIRLSPTEEVPYFELSKHFDDTGETMPFQELDKIRQIIDIQFKNPGFTNMYLVDLAQNKKIMGDFYMLPYITQLIAPWMEFTR
jgi:hypothetical protein